MKMIKIPRQTASRFGAGFLNFPSFVLLFELPIIWTNMLITAVKEGIIKKYSKKSKELIKG
ncbi:hypothetical protein C3V36_09810 [Lachnospiraceae bacterium oral taxon 500]|nr:hypothetical protein C3V36_09810 [Lachnospiraceae bacterium oral taxon 500]